jgi:hypothetical protein
VFCEGEIDVMSFWKLGIPACCISGSYISDAHARIIRAYADELVVFMDSDKAGHRAVWGYFNDEGEFKPGIVDKLESFVRLSIAPKHFLDANVMMRTGRGNRLRQLIELSERSFVAHRLEAVL